jgi:tRNA A-37 threonylcarbamoyl transferase component Bud32/WD40 repeat protein
MASEQVGSSSVPVHMDASALNDSTPLGRSLAERYTVLREIGAGGMAKVFLAEDLRHRRKVAIKVLHPELSAVIGSERFLKEIELTANLQHPHILPLFDSGDADGQLYYVMPYVEGETLRARLDREQQLPVADAVRIAREVADALAYAHKRGVVHRDIKPENVLLQDGHALVADFGIALAVQQAGAGRLTQTGLSLGTPQYMSPEQAMGERVIDQRTDIYALGAVTYEMLAGEPPFTGPTAQAIIARAMTERPRSLVSVRETLPPAVNQAVMTALAKLPADRFSTASEFSDALTREGTSAVNPSPAVAQSARTTRALVPLAMLAAGLIIGGVLTKAFLRPAAATGESAPRFWSIALPDSAPFVVGHDRYDQQLRSLDVSPDGQSVAWATLRDSTATLWEARVDLGSATPLGGTAGGALPTYAPDGSAIAFVVGGTEIRRLDRGSSAPSRVGEVALANGLLWPLQERVITNDYNGCLNAATPGGGAFASFPSPACIGVAGGIAKGPDPQRLLASKAGALGVLDAKSGNFTFLRRTGGSDTTTAATLVAGDVPFLIDSHTIGFMRDSTVYAVSFDAKSERLTGDPRQILAGVRHEAAGGVVGAQLALGASGTLAWVTGGDAGVSHFVLVRTAGGAPDTLPIPPTNVNSYALSPDGQRLAYSVSLPGNKSVLRILDRRRNVVDSARFAIEVQVANWVDAGSGVSVSLPIAGQKGRQYGIVRGLGGSMTLDTTEAPYYASSADGKLRCSATGTFWPASAPADTVRFDRRGNWCRFSPDGGSISWDEASAGLMVAPTTRAAGTLRRKVAPAGANEARWSRDGRELIYRKGNQWFAVPSQPAADGSLTPPRLVHRGTYSQAFASWDLAPDGRLLLLQGPPPTRTTHLNVLTNFPRYVREKLRTGSPR